MFQSREEAGRLLAERLKGLEGIKEAKGIVLGIPRGGVVVAKVIAQKLGWPLDVVVVKKIGAPGQRELAIGAVAEGDVKVIDWEMALRMGVEKVWLDKEVKRLRLEVGERARAYRTYKSHKSYKSHETYILTDDGVATGATVEAGIKAIKKILRYYLPRRQAGDITILREREKKQRPTISQYRNIEISKFILAIPVGARGTVKRLRKMVDEVVVLEEPSWFSAVGQFYREFPEVSDEEVVKMLKK